MIVSFLYNGKNYTTNDLQKKLSKLGITESDIVIPKRKVNAVPEWKEKGLIKHRWINKNPNSSEYNYSIIGFHYPDVEVKRPLHLNEDWVYEERC